ncbi:MAG: hypothetical protein Q9160_000622 [Pyrenula sp. 1 TL-2023]
MPDDYDDEDYFLPLQDQRVFGASIKRKRVPFVSASTLSSVTDSSASASKKEASSVDRYLSIVLPNDPSTDSSNPNTNATEPLPDLCTICSLPLQNPTTSSPPTRTTAAHESLLAHQACLPHSHPPSHLPRQHVGLRYLTSYGWDPDSRQGLGRAGEGIRVPIKGKVKNDTVGLGVYFAEEDKKSENRRRRKASERAHESQKKLNAKEVRKMELKGRRKEEKLRGMFYGNGELERYLGEGG